MLFKKEYLLIFAGLFVLVFARSVQAQVSQKPMLVKLPFAFSDGGRAPMESTPIHFNSRLLLVSNHRPGGFEAKGENAYLYIEDLHTGQEVSRFGKGHSFVSAYVNSTELNVFALEFSDFGRIINSKGIDRFVTTDLETWTKETVIIPEGNENLFNSSVCKDEDGYLMAYESDVPVKFCFKFARSSNLSRWEKIPDIVFTGENHEYSACPVIRYFNPYYYVIYLHAPVIGYNGWISYMARSKDLIEWELTPFNPVLEAEKGEGQNASDVDILEHEGRTYLYYAIGDQATWGTIRVAMFDGPMKTFYESYFPKGEIFKVITAK